MDRFDILIIGGGPAGLSAGLTLGRARRHVAIVDAARPRNRFATHTHGVLGHDGRSPLELASLGRGDVSRYGGTMIEAMVARVTREREGGFACELDSGDILSARRLLVATGSRDDLPAIAGLAEQWGTGVVMCPYCHGWEARDGRIGVIGTGPMSVHQAQMLRQWSATVSYLPCAAGAPVGDDARALAARGITVESRAVVRVLADSSGRLRGVELDDGHEMTLDAIFTAPRPVPLDDALLELGAVRSDGPMGAFVAVDPTGKTEIDGVWAVGNVTNPIANVAMVIGAGAFTAMAINADLVGEDIRLAVAASET